MLALPSWPSSAICRPNSLLPVLSPCLIAIYKADRDLVLLFHLKAGQAAGHTVTLSHFVLAS